ncbi:MAG: c-type cytochrome [Anaerolineae bacterium]
MLKTLQPRKFVLVIYVLAGVLVLSACGNLREQPSYRAYEPSDVFGSSAWELDENAVAVGLLNEDEHLYNGTVDGSYAESFPFEITEDMLAEGQRWYEGFCSPCHGYSGYGDGVIRLEGYPSPGPRSHHDDELRAAPVGFYFDVITNGSESGLMWPLASRIPPEQRWAIIAYIRALQFSQNADMSTMGPDVQASASN